MMDGTGSDDRKFKAHISENGGHKEAGKLQKRNARG